MIRFKIKRATSEDVKRLVELSMRLADEQSAMDSLYKPGRDRAKELQTSLKKAVANPRYLVLVAQCKGSIVGCVSGRIEKARKGVQVSKVGYIGGLYVVPSFRRQGIGTNLVRLALKWLKKKGIKVVETYADERNVASLKALKKSGFAEWQKLMLVRFKD